MGDVIRLVDSAPGYSVESEACLIEWAKNWVDAFGSDDYEKIKSIVIVAETESGTIAVVSQSMGRIDSCRLAGMLTVAAHRKLDGGARPEDIRKEAMP